jgi:hypothetical protein
MGKCSERLTSFLARMLIEDQDTAGKVSKAVRSASDTYPAT